MATAPYSSFGQTPAETQKIFNDVWGNQAAAQWTAENAKNYPAAAAAIDPNVAVQQQIAAGQQQVASNQAQANIATAAASAAANAVNAAQQKAQQAYWEALAGGMDKDRAEKAAEFAATQELERQKVSLAAQNQAYSQGMGVLGLQAQLQGPANAFVQQAVIHGLNASGLSRAVDALNGTVLPSFQANQGTPQAASLQSLISQLYPGGVTFNGPASGQAAVPSISNIMSSPSGNWTGAASSTNSPQLSGSALTTYQVLTANNGSPAAGMTQDQFQAYMNTHGGATPPDAWGLANWVKANPAATAMNTAPAPTVTAPAVGAAPGAPTVPGAAPGSTQDYINALPAPNKINAPNWMELDKDTQQFLLGAYRQAGYSDNDVLGAVKNTLPTFSAPAVGAIGKI